MLGTIVNTTAIIVGAVIGSYLKRGIILFFVAKRLFAL
jgi:uncharacterized membrane protein YqgA involved in biofilm formation